jgi:hypothetical protein
MKCFVLSDPYSAPPLTVLLMNECLVIRGDPVMEPQTLLAHETRTGINETAC